MGFIADTIEGISSAFDSVVDIVEDIVDAVVDIFEEIGDFLFGWLIPDMPDMSQFEAMLQGDGLMVNKRNSNDSLPVIYGTRRVGGNIVWLAVSPDNQFLYMVIALCEGQVARFTELYIDDVLYATYTGSDSTYGTAQTISSLASASTSVPTNTSGLTIETDHPVYSGIETVEGVDTTHYLTNFIFFNGTDTGLNLAGENFLPEMSSLGRTSLHSGIGICNALFKLCLFSKPCIGFV